MSKLKEKYLTKRNKKIGIILLCLLIIAVIVIILIKNSSFAEEESDSINLICPSTVSKGEIVECSVVLNSLTIAGTGFQTFFETDPEIEYVDFVGEECNANNCSVSENGLVMFSLNNGISGYVQLGKLKYQIPENAEPNSVYTIKLTGSILGGNDSENNVQEIDFEDISTEVRVASDVNTLSNIEIVGGTLNETFSPSVNEYTATIDEDMITIDAPTTDEHATVEGTGEISLHYGTNIINIKVISESNTEKLYKLSIFRPYSFSTDTYTYNKDNNYLYTKADTSEGVIISNITLPNDLNADINNNKLVINYEEEKLLEVNIINISSSKYEIAGGKIFIGSNTEYSELISNITLNGVTIKVLNNNEEITSGTISGNNKVAIYYGNEKIDEYSIVEDYYNIDESLIVDNTNKIIKKVKVDTTYNKLLEKISTNGTITVKSKDNETVSKDSKVKTGDIIQIKLSGTTYEYKVSVLGDINGDGIINTGDVALLYRNLKGKTTLDNYQLFAGDILNDGIIKINDIARLFRYYKGKISTLEVE